MKTIAKQRGFDFPLIMAIEANGMKLDLPRDVYILYCKSKLSAKEKEILIKWQNGKELNDIEYKILIKNSLCKKKDFIYCHTNKEGINAILEIYGIGIKHSNQSEKYDLIEESLPRIKSEVFDHILLNILMPFYSKILKSLFPDMDIYLGPERNEADDGLHSLSTAFRIAFYFSLISFLYGENRKSYESFQYFFSKEFEKRARLVKNIWITKGKHKTIKYIPIFDSFKNYNRGDAQFIISIIKNMLKTNEILLNDNNEIENQLIKQAQSMHRVIDHEFDSIKSDILQPAVSLVVNIKKAEQFLKSAKENFKKCDFDSTINRCYYSMMRALRALLTECRILGSWRNNILSPHETHKSLELKLEQEIIKNKKLMDISDLADFKYVFEQRLLADYNEIYLDSTTCRQCIKKATTFINKIKTIIYS